MSDPKQRALELVGAIDELWQNECDLEAPIAALRLAITQIPTTHIWVPIAECGELADGWYRVLMQGDDHPAPYQRSRRTSYGRFAPVHGTQVTHVLSPHLGPIPEDMTSQQQPVPFPQSCNKLSKASTAC